MLGISILVTVLLDKYLFYRPTYRLLADWRSHGLDLSLGTLTDGLKRMVPLLEPVYEALVKRSQGQRLWHADETRWLDVHFVTRSSVLIDLDYSGSLWERGSSCTKITLGPQAHGCSPCRCLSRTLFVCPIHSVPNSRP